METKALWILLHSLAPYLCEVGFPSVAALKTIYQNKLQKELKSGYFEHKTKSGQAQSMHVLVIRNVLLYF